jgi:hypothetical protein
VEVGVVLMEEVAVEMVLCRLSGDRPGFLVLRRLEIDQAQAYNQLGQCPQMGEAHRNWRF